MSDSEPLLTDFEFHCYIVLFLVCGILSYAYTALRAKNPYPDIAFLSPDEKVFLNPSTDNQESFPSLDDAPSLHLSVIVPAYNEETRLRPMLDEALAFLRARQTKQPQFSYEILVASDGSTDGTVALAQEYSRQHGADTVRALELRRNRGKGGAVTLGTFCARGAVILFADADGATKFSELVKLEEKLKALTGKDYTQAMGASESLGMLVGSRAHLEALANVQRSFFRNVLMKGFHAIVWFSGVRTIRDTQCGFKLFTRRTARQLFTSIHVSRWAFDVELLFIAEVLGMPLAELAVDWTEIEGSKIVPVFSWIQMGWDVLNIWLHYTFGLWKIKALDCK